MIDLVAHNLAPIMFVSVMAMLLLGYPVAFTLAAGGLIFFVLGVEFSSISPEINLFWPLLQSHPDRFFGGIMSNETLLAVPFFTFMGIILERSRMAEDLLDIYPRKVYYFPVSGRVMLKKMMHTRNDTVIERERAYADRLSAAPVAGDIELFG